MRFEDVPRTGDNKKIENYKKDAEALLWNKLENLTAEKDELKQKAAYYFGQNKGKDLPRLNIYERDIYGENEKQYWALLREVEKIQEAENNVSLVIERIENDVLGEGELKDIINELSKNSEDYLSKRKRKLLEEKERMGIDPREVEYGVAGGPQVAKPSTGRNLKRVKGNMSSFDAAEIFYNKTADTHGGKVAAGKNGNVYASGSGKNIRKK